jgi:hypothetical protein
MKFKVDGRELDASGIRVGELCEAEKALGLNMADGSGASIAVSLFVAMRREDRNSENPKPLAMLADEVMAADVTTFEEADDESPPAEAPAANGAGKADPVLLPTSGTRRSASTA